MTRTTRILPFVSVALLALSACSQSPDPNARKAISSCLAVSAADASAILGGTLTANRISGDDAPRSICSYNDASNTPMALVELSKQDDKIKDTAADLGSDNKMVLSSMNGLIKPAVTHPADGFGAGAFYGDISPHPGASMVQFYAYMDGYKLQIVINNPKDFPTGEQQAATMAKKVDENIKNGNAFATL
ncbi:MAG: hypothetical protein ACM3ZT_04070 [Bacillota bacterium]